MQPAHLSRLQVLPEVLLMGDLSTSANCGLLLGGVACPGQVYVVEMAKDMGDGRWVGYSVCDTCQAKYEVTMDEDGRRPEVFITTGRARGVPEDQRTIIRYPAGEDDA